MRGQIWRYPVAHVTAIKEPAIGETLGLGRIRGLRHRQRAGASERNRSAFDLKICGPPRLLIL